MTQTAVVARSASPHHRPNAYRKTMSEEYRYLSAQPSGDRPERSSNSFSDASRMKVSLISRS